MIMNAKDRDQCKKFGGGLLLSVLAPINEPTSLKRSAASSELYSGIALIGEVEATGDRQAFVVNETNGLW